MSLRRPFFFTFLASLWWWIALTANGKEGVPSPPPELSHFRLVILHTGDVHSHYSAFDRLVEARYFPEMENYGGVARIATLFRQYRPAGNTLFVDAGDQFQGTLFHTFFRGEAASAIMNGLRYHAMTLGNHEFDEGSGVLGRFISTLKFPVVCSNVEFPTGSDLFRRVKKREILTVGGERVGLLGCVAEDTAVLSRPGPGVIFSSIEESLKREGEALEREGVNKIILLSHAGLNRDVVIAKRVPGIDVIVGGHSHSLLSNRIAGAVAPYPLWVKGPHGEGVPIVTAHEWGGVVGRLGVSFSADGTVISAEGEPLVVHTGVVEDPEMAGIVARFLTRFASAGAEIVGSTSCDLIGGAGTRIAETNLGNLVCDALLSATASEGAVIALQNGGGIRGSLPKGPITLAKVVEVHPFENLVTVLELTGAQIREALEWSVADFQSSSHSGGGKFLQVAGIRVEFNRHGPTGGRVQRVVVVDPAGGERPLDIKARYRVVTNDFLADGGDHFAMLRDPSIPRRTLTLGVREAILHFLRHHSPVNPRIEGRIQREN